MPAPRGVPQIEVVFDIDANGILSVTAKDKAANRVQTIRIEGSTGVSKDEADRMKREAEVNAEADKKKQEAVTVKNNADNLIYTTEKTLRDIGEKIPASSKKELEDLIEGLKKVKDTDNIEDVKAKTDQLSQAVSKAGAEFYQKNQQQGSQDPQGNVQGQDKKEGGADEADFKEA
jgi:molecular chaperone DnaK